MNPLNPSPALERLSLAALERFDLWIPPGCWSLAAGALFLTGVLVAGQVLARRP